MATPLLSARLPEDIVDVVMRRAHRSALHDDVHPTMTDAWQRFKYKRTRYFSDKLQDVYCDLSYYDYLELPVPASILRELYDARYALTCYADAVMASHTECVWRVQAWSERDDEAFGVDPTIPALVSETEHEGEDADSVS